MREREMEWERHKRHKVQAFRNRTSRWQRSERHGGSAGSPPVDAWQPRGEPGRGPRRVSTPAAPERARSPPGDLAAPPLPPHPARVSNATSGTATNGKKRAHRRSTSVSSYEEFHRDLSGDKCQDFSVLIKIIGQEKVEVRRCERKNTYRCPDDQTECTK